MVDCCAVPKGKASNPKRHCCPRNGREYAEVAHFAGAAVALVGMSIIVLQPAYDS